MPLHLPYLILSCTAVCHARHSLGRARPDPEASVSSPPAPGTRCPFPALRANRQMLSSFSIHPSPAAYPRDRHDDASEGGQILSVAHYSLLPPPSLPDFLSSYEPPSPSPVPLLTRAIGMTILRKAARYSASPIGGLQPPDHATFTLKPMPSSTPHCKQDRVGAGQARSGLCCLCCVVMT